MKKRSAIKPSPSFCFAFFKALSEILIFCQEEGEEKYKKIQPKLTS